MVRHAQSAQNNFTISFECLKKEVSNEVDFLNAKVSKFPTN